MSLAILKGYVDCALWASSDDGGVSHMDRNYGPQDVSWESIISMWADIESFMAQLDGETFTDEQLAEMRDDEHMGHDLWLTRNGHGAGYWDGDYPLTGDKLTRIAKALGECDLYAGDDGKLYVTP